MKINDVILANAAPLSIQVLLDDNTTVDIVPIDGGEALIRLGDQAVERYTALSENDIDLSEFWGQMAEFKPRLLMIPDESKFTGFNPLPWELLSTVSTVANYPTNPRSDIIELRHEYATKTMMPGLRKDLSVAYRRSDQTDPHHLYYFADLMDWLSAMGDDFNVQFMVGKLPNGVSVTARYKGLRDNRHLKLNDLFDSAFGVRYVKEATA